MTRHRFADVSLTTRLSLVVLLVTLLSLAVTAVVGLVRGSELADDLVDDRLVTIASARSDAVEIFVQSVRREIGALAASPAAADAVEGLAAAYQELAAQPVSGATTDELTAYYLSEVVPELEQVRGVSVGASFQVPSRPAAIYLQNAYTVPHEDELGDVTDPALVVDPGDGSTYSGLHPAVHRTYGQIGLLSGYDDVYLIEAETDTIVYSARKRIDFATSLDVGPVSGSALARLVDSIAVDPQRGLGRITDFSPYVPNGERPTAFVAAPVFDGDELVGYLAAAVSFTALDAVVSGDGTWSGSGESGDAYVVGVDGTMRTTARPFADDPGAYLAAAAEPGPAQLNERDRRRMRATGTTALVQHVEAGFVDAALASPGIGEVTDYRGVDVVAAHRPIDIDGLEWALVAQIPTVELDRPVEDYARNMLVAIALFVVVVTFLAVRWSDRLVAPIRTIATRLRAVRAPAGARAASVDTGVVGLDLDRGDTVEFETASTTPDGRAAVQHGPIEFEDLSANVDEMLQRLARRQREVAARADERTALVRQFLPASVARRREAGDVLDHAHNASVVVVVVDGLDRLLLDRDEQAVRDLLAEVIDEVDALAVDLGVERVKISGAAYYAVCGVNRPYLDHAPRAVRFALAAEALVGELTDPGIAVRAGVDSGPVSVGLTDRAGLVYDVWGDTVVTAEALARSAPSGSVVASATTRTQLSDEFALGDTGGGGATVVTGQLAAQGGAR